MLSPATHQYANMETCSGEGQRKEVCSRARGQRGRGRVSILAHLQGIDVSFGFK
jgi:hypothetical protein